MNSIPSWRNDPAVVEAYRALADLTADEPRLIAARDAADARLAKARNIHDEADRKSLIGKCSAKDLARARDAEHEAKVAVAQAVDDIEMNQRRRAALDAELPNIVEHAQADTGSELLKVWNALVGDLAKAIDSFAATRDQLAHFADTVSFDYRGITNHNGYSTTVGFPHHDVTAVLATANALRHELNDGRVDSWRKTARSAGAKI
jgi:hypothetical protein